MFDVWQAIKKEEAYILDLYKDFHRHPEIGGKEQRTIQVVMRELETMGVKCEYREGAGVIGYINRGKEGRKIALRADMDALPMTESPDNLIGPKEVISTTDQAMHACGHDGHTAMLLGAAKVLSEHAAEIPGEVILLFEQGEENGYGVQGIARVVIEEKPDVIWGMHLWADLPTGKISVEAGPRMAAASGFSVEIKGQGGHGSRPDLSNNPLDCFVDIYNNMNMLAMKNLNPFKATTFSVGRVHMGTAANIIPETITFGGTFRFTDLNQSKTVIAKMEQILEHSCALHQCTYEVQSGLKPTGMMVYNHPGYSSVAQQSVAKVLGADAIQSCEPAMGSETMAVYFKYAPGVFAFLGINNPDKGTGASHHNPQFEIDQDVLVLGAAATAQYAIDALKADVDTSDFTASGHSPSELSAKPWLA